MKAKINKQNKPTIFTTIRHISETRPFEYRDIVEENAPYEPFMVNRAFSLSEDTVIAASLMNLSSHLDKDQQATFYIHTIRPRRRFEKWPKSLENDEINVIAKYYGMSRREASLHSRLHTQQEIDAMMDIIEEGATPSRN